MAEPKKWKDRKFRALLYPEDPTHAAAMKLLESGGYTYAAILHDKDVWTAEDETDNEKPVPPDLIGTLKKPHWHVVLKFTNPVYNIPTAQKLGIAWNYLKPCDSLDKALLYLTHESRPTKHQYDLEEVFGSLKTRLAALLADDDEGTRALTIYNLIRNSPGIVTYSEIFEKAIKAGLYGDFRRMGNGVGWLIRDHNDAIEAEYRSKLDHDLKINHQNALREQVKNMDWVERLDRLGRQKVEPDPL